MYWPSVVLHVTVALEAVNEILLIDVLYRLLAWPCRKLADADHGHLATT